LPKPLTTKNAFLTEHDKIDCSFSLNGKRGGMLAHLFYPGTRQIHGDVHFDIECFTHKRIQPGSGKYNIFSVATHALGHSLGRNTRIGP